ncbi:Sulfate starvation-induced protein 2 [Kingella potus]|uniref:Sulfate starvation-induced protein 2 n=1 Tax=Kingella potus TaxID=265175 RepID=A0A377R1I7_9NEIS|nr:sulfate ABC transporter substrate-binding protein [Kingella potus]UOP01524.1 sulfate ABC transporter substrate-binding protein [Kingella potus]STR00181.1 Sulfate starvation-induced protein 2 [Kingella potus]
MTAKTLAAALAFAAALSACAPDNAAQHSASGGSAPASDSVKLLNVSYDVARDLYKDYNPLFIKEYRKKHPGRDITVQQSHGGSSKQALAVANGLQADVVTMNQGSDIDLLVKKGLVKAGWRKAFPNDASPFTSASVFLVRKGNPKQIKDWDDLSKDGVKLVVANPKTSGNGRYTYLGAYGYALKAGNGNDAQARAYVKKLLANVEVFESGGRSATTTFMQRKIGDVLVTFENEANLSAKQFGSGEYEIVYPKYTIRMDSPVAVVDSVADKRGTREAAAAYLGHLWSKPAQELGAKLYLRPADPQVLAAHAANLPPLDTFDPNTVFGAWDKIMAEHFADGGLFDQLASRDK